MAKKIKKSKRSILVKWGKGFFLIFALLGAFTWYSNFITDAAGKGVIFENVNEVSDVRVGLIFGCNAKFDGRNNTYFVHRIEAASELWRAGKVKGFIVSGDNSRDDYNEPEDMKKALVAKGVPEDKVLCDFAGLRTLDSVLRVKEVFGVNQVLFVSQRFQCERAQYMASQYGVDAISYVAQDVVGTGGWKTKLREILARPKMVLDLHLLGTRPKYLGQKEIVPFL